MSINNDLTLALLIYITLVFYLHNNYPHWAEQYSNMFPLLALVCYYIVSVL